MSRKNELLCSLTTRLHPRDFIAVKMMAAEKRMTESAYVRWLVSNSVEVATTEVSEAELDALKHKTATARKQSDNRSWIKRMFAWRSQTR